MARLADLLSIADVRDRARRVLPRFVFDFIDGGAEDELTLADNRAAFERQRLVPRVLVDVAEPETACPIVGSPAAAPLLICPMGSCALAWPEADFALARAATRRGLPYTLSTMATTRLETMARAVQGRLWFQLYVLRDQAMTSQLVERARAADYEALVVTVDLPAGGKRERDLRNGISIPLRIGPRLIRDAMIRPGWVWRMARHPQPAFENVRGLLGDDSAGLTIAARVGQNLDARYDWGDLARLRDQWPRKLLVKGVEHPADAKRLAALGVDGIWISNHGGRQLDGAIASFDAVPAIRAAVGDDLPLLLDSGVRRGIDVLKAVGRGVEAVGIGRAALYGAAVAGEAGVERVLDILLGELTLAMKLAGIARLSDPDPTVFAGPAAAVNPRR